MPFAAPMFPISARRQGGDGVGAVGGARVALLSTTGNVGADLRPSARERGYTPAWDRASKGFLAKHPLCLGCEAIGVVTAATLTDHQIPHKGDRVLFWQRKLWQPSCDWHHDVIKQEMERRFAAGQCEVNSLRLDSVLAIGLTQALWQGRPKGEGGSKV